MSLDCSAGACAERQRSHASPSKIKISSKRMLPQKNIPRDWTYWSPQHLTHFLLQKEQKPIAEFRCPTTSTSSTYNFLKTHFAEWLFMARNCANRCHHRPELQVSPLALHNLSLNSCHRGGKRLPPQVWEWKMWKMGIFLPSTNPQLFWDLGNSPSCRKVRNVGPTQTVDCQKYPSTHQTSLWASESPCSSVSRTYPSQQVGWSQGRHNVSDRISGRVQSTPVTPYVPKHLPSWEPRFVCDSSSTLSLKFKKFFPYWARTPWNSAVNPLSLTGHGQAPMSRHSDPPGALSWPSHVSRSTISLPRLRIRSAIGWTSW